MSRDRLADHGEVEKSKCVLSARDKQEMGRARDECFVLCSTPAYLTPSHNYVRQERFFEMKGARICFPVFGLGFDRQRPHARWQGCLF